MHKAIIFDFFGVIGHSTYQLVVRDIALSRTQKDELNDLHKALDNGFIDTNEFLQRYAAILQLEYAEFINRYYVSLERFTTTPDMLAFVQQLRKSYKVGLLSNVGAEGYFQFIEPLVRNFDAVVASFQVQLAKPEVAIYELMAAKLGVHPTECIMIDDSETNCEGARAAGMEAIVFSDINAAKLGLRSLGIAI